jgi:hypothetical protein
MPEKRASVKNERQYEALKEKGNRELAGCIEPRREEVPLGLESQRLLSGRNDRSKEGSWSQRR